MFETMIPHRPRRRHTAASQACGAATAATSAWCWEYGSHVKRHRLVLGGRVHGRRCDAIVDVDYAVGDTLCLTAAADWGCELDAAPVMT